MRHLPINGVQQFGLVSFVERSIYGALSCMTAQHLSSIQPIRRINRMGRSPVWVSAGMVLSLSGLWLMGTPSLAIAQPSSNSVLSAQASEAKTTTTLFVNPMNGNDATGDGSDRAPFKTITRALDVASANTVIQLAPGTYSTATGETFPIALKPRVTLQGDPATRGQAIVIQGGGSFASPSLGQQNITILGGANQASIVGVTITNPNSNGYGIQIESSSPTITNSTLSGNGRGGVVIVGSSASVIRDNFFSQNGESVRIQGNARPTVQENVFEQSKTGIAVSDMAAPLIVGNRITQNKTGISLDGQAQPQLRSNSVEGNEQFGLVAIAQSRPDLGSASDMDANFFRNNGQKDIALQTPSAPPAAQKPTAPPDSQTLERNEFPVPSPSVTPVTQQPQNSTPARSNDPGSVVVPVVAAPSIPAVPIVPFGDRAPMPTSNPSALPSQPKSLPSPKIVPAPVESSAPSPGITSTAFPMPSALSGANRTAEAARPMQVIQLESTSESSTPALRRILTPPVVPNSTPPASVTPFPTPPLASQEITAPPRVFPRLSTAPVISPRLPIGVMPQIPAPLAPLPGVMPLPARAIALPVPKPDAAAIVAPRPVMIPVPLPEGDRVSPVPVRAAKPILSPLSPLPMANLPASTNSGNLLPVPNASPPLGNVSGMPKVYSMGSGRQPAPGMIPITPENAGFVVVKYRVVVVATDNSQQEQLRAIVPDAFPVVYRGQRLMQAGAFGDRAKADELVASLNTQGLQAIIEPLR